MIIGQCGGTTGRLVISASEKPACKRISIKHLSGAQQQVRADAGPEPERDQYFATTGLQLNL
jgi:hypothetical protein